MTTRSASHAGSWYSASATRLSGELDQWLSQVPDSIGEKTLPMSGARVIIAPHAGYSYSGPAAAWAYKSLDLSKATRIFLLGPSHVISLPDCAISSHSQYATPLGDLKLDLSTIKELVATGKFSSWKTGVEEREHSLEMHLPYIYKMLSNHFKSVDEFPPLVPILVGNTSPTVEKAFGKLLAPYLADPTSVFIVSSDFCHWGDNFDYKYYLHPPTPKLPAKGDASKPTSEDHELTEPPAGVSIHYLGPRDQHLIGPPIYESIEYLDTMTMNAIKTGKHEVFLNNLRKTGNTVCGRHPIGVVMAALEILNAENKFSEKGNGRFEFLRYERSSMVEKINGSSVSYVSAVAIL